MDRVAVFVDAGYLYAGGAKSVTGLDGTKRHEINLDLGAVIPYLIAKAEAISQQKLLRIYWYDAAPSSRLTTDHQILASTDNVKLRLGVINGYGQQKGVDGKVITDLTELSRNRAFADAVLLGGDEDLRIGVELAQEYGARIHLFTIEGSGSSPTLKQECDTTTVLPRADITTFLTVRPAPGATAVVALAATAATTTYPATVVASGTVASASATSTPSAAPASIPPASTAPPSTAPPPTSPSPVTAVKLATPTPGSSSVGALMGTSSTFEVVAQEEVKNYLASLTSPDRVSLETAMKTGAGVPAEHDGRMLARTRSALGRALDHLEKAKLRKALKKELGV